MGAYTETQGGFPARFDARTEKMTELHMGLNGEHTLKNGVTVIGTVEAVHQFEGRSAVATGEILGLSNFQVSGSVLQQDWARMAIGTKWKLADGQASLMLNGTSLGNAPSYWVAAAWQKRF